MRTAFVFLLALAPAWAQPIKFPPSLEKLAKNASESVDVTLDASMLQLAGKFLSGKDADEAKAKKLIQGLKGIYVRAFEFDKEGAYSEADLEGVRSQLTAPAWVRIVGVQSNAEREKVDVFTKAENGQIVGMCAISSEPKELAVVYIDGPINPEDLADLAGHFGVPKLDLPKSKTGKAEKK